MVGSVVSVIVIVNVSVNSPQSFVAVTVMLVVPTAKKSPEATGLPSTA